MKPAPEDRLEERSVVEKCRQRRDDDLGSVCGNVSRDRHSAAGHVQHQLERRVLRIRRASVCASSPIGFLESLDGIAANLIEA